MAGGGADVNLRAVCNGVLDLNVNRAKLRKDPKTPVGFRPPSLLLPMKIPLCFALSALALATFAPAAQYDQRVANLSTRGQVGTGANVMITGFVVGPGASKDILIRAIGPQLTRFGVTGAITDPVLGIYNSAGQLVRSNDNWTSATADRATMLSVGAFDLTNNSRDAALIARLAPGTYTAQVSGVNNGTGVGLLEVYDITGAARLMNISTRAVVGTAGNVLISGLSIAPGGGARRLLIRAIGPGLGGFGVTGFLADPVLSIMRGNQQVTGNDNWQTGNIPAEVAQAATQAAAFPLAAGSRDAALVTNLEPDNYTVVVSGAANTSGIALIEIYDLTPENLSTVSVRASVPSTDTAGAAPGELTFSRTGATGNSVTVSYAVSGTAVAGVDYQPLPGTVTIPAGATSTTVKLTPIAGAQNNNNKTATITLTPKSDYGVGTADNASVTIYFNPGTLYVANLRASSAASTAYGTATITLSPDQKSAFVSVTFSNLSSPQVVGHLALGAPGTNGDYVFTLPQGQVDGSYWALRAIGTHTVDDVLAALKSGNIYVGIDTSNFPDGELRGHFVRSTGAAAFNAPDPAPAIDLSKVSATDAARFLTQATFGPWTGDIEAVMRQGYVGWINAQMALPASSHRSETMADFAANNAGGQAPNADRVNTRPGNVHRQHAWWKIALTGEDQLRQRVAFALSQILVISDQNGTVNAWQEGAAHYYDALARHAFGNFRDLIEEVTLSPMMGVYLSHMRNAKATGGALPDENYAREIMQLFTIGLNQLHPDGTLKLDPSGRPIPTYNQTIIAEMAKVFTGWAFYTLPGQTQNFRGGRTNNSSWVTPMELYPAFHEDGAKAIFDNIVIPPNQGGAKDLADVLDALVAHPNTGPFIARQLIQRLVTSNPSPGYVYRVARAFADNGGGVRGDLGAVVRAILLDYEARSPEVADNLTFGKLKEPLLRTTALLRAFNARTNTGRLPINNANAQISQSALSAPTVFNFFEPAYVHPGALASAGLYAPEFQILTDTTAITLTNYLYGYIYATRPTAATSNTVYLDYTSFLPLATQPANLVGQLNLLLAAGSMPATARDRIVAGLNALPSNTAALDRVRAAIYLTVSTPQGAIQK